MCGKLQNGFCRFVIIAMISDAFLQQSTWSDVSVCHRQLHSLVAGPLALVYSSQNTII